MPLLTEDLKSRLPPLNSQEAEPDPIVYAKFFLPGTSTAWYPIEGQQAGSDFVFYGFLTQPVYDFGQFTLSQLEQIRGLHDACVERDLDFEQGRLTDVVPAPEL